LAQPYSTIGGETAAWASFILWGANVLRGESVTVNTMAWDDNIVWGMDDNIVWGMNTAWGDGLLATFDGDNIVWSNVSDADNIVWGELDDDNIVWGMDDDNIVWGMNR
jgi:hypothetical protein